MKKSDIIEVLDQEIAWCEGHQETPPTEYQKGYREGFKQARFLIKGMPEIEL